VRNFLADALVALLPASPRGEGRKESLLLVRLDAIGDYILWLDAAAALRTLFPPERFHLVLAANALWAELAEATPYFDEVLPIEVKRLVPELRYRVRTWLKIRSRSCSMAVNPTFSRHFPFDDSVMRICGAPERIGSTGDLANQRAWEKRLSDRWYTKLLAASAWPLMELERNAEFVRALGLTGFQAGVPVLPLSLESVDPFPGRRYCVMVPGASLAVKQWPVQHFAEVGKRIWHTYGVGIVICGSGADAPLGRRLQESIAAEVPACEVRTGSTTLTEFAALIKGASFVVANDSSAVHIASAVGTASFCLVGGAHYGRFVPYRVASSAPASGPVAISHPMECYGCNLNCRFDLPEGASAPCLERITVDQVWSEITRAVDEKVLQW